MSKKAIFVANTGFALFNFRLALMKYLSHQGWSVIGVANDEADYERKFKREGFRFINVFIDDKGTNFVADLLFAFRLRKLYNNERPDLVHHFTIKPVIFGSLAAKLTGLSAVVNSVTGLGYAFTKDGWLRELVVGLYRVALLGRPKVIFQNSDDYSLFVSKGIIRRNEGYVILGSGVNTRAMRPAYSTHVGNGKTRFVLVSRMLWSKGISEYVRAAEIVKRRFPETSFVMAGGASGGGAAGNPDAIPEEWLHSVNERGCVRWVGRVPSEEAILLLEKSEVFVLPSYYPEGIPRSLIEAAAKGKPIITTDTPGCREVVENALNGFLVPCRNVDSLAESMMQFIRKPYLIGKMGIASRKRAEEVFDERLVLARIAAVYRDAGVSLKQPKQV